MATTAAWLLAAWYAIAPAMQVFASPFRPAGLLVSALELVLVVWLVVLTGRYHLAAAIALLLYSLARLVIATHSSGVAWLLDATWLLLCIAIAQGVVAIHARRAVLALSPIRDAG